MPLSSTTLSFRRVGGILMWDPRNGKLYVLFVAMAFQENLPYIIEDTAQ